MRVNNLDWTVSSVVWNAEILDRDPYIARLVIANEDTILPDLSLFHIVNTPLVLFAGDWNGRETHVIILELYFCKFKVEPAGWEQVHCALRDYHKGFTND